MMKENKLSDFDIKKEKAKLVRKMIVSRIDFQYLQSSKEYHIEKHKKELQPIS